MFRFVVYTGVLTTALIAILLTAGLVFADPATAARCADALGGVAFFAFLAGLVLAMIWSTE